MKHAHDAPNFTRLLRNQADDASWKNYRNLPDIPAIDRQPIQAILKNDLSRNISYLLEALLKDVGAVIELVDFQICQHQRANQSTDVQKGYRPLNIV